MANFISMLNGNKYKLYATFQLLALCLLMTSCTKNEIEVVPIPPCEGGSTEVSYSNHIAPLIKAKCSTGLGPGTGCHDAWILTYDGVKGSADNGSLIRTIVIDKTMPKIPNNFGIEDLTDEEINILICWVENGSPNN